MNSVMCVIDVSKHPEYRTGGWTFVPQVGSIYTVIGFFKAGQPVSEGITIWDSYHIKEGDGSFPVDCFETLEEESEQIIRESILESI